MSDPQLDEALIKDLTGGDTISARFLHKEWFDFKPTHALWMYGNHKPRIKGKDEGIWRRPLLVPFTVMIPEGRRDKRLKERLLEERSGILNWVIAGCLMWQKEGLAVPPLVREATERYREESDSVQEFVNERCVRNREKETKSSAVYESYKRWCDGIGDDAEGTGDDSNLPKQALTLKEFKQALESKGFIQKRKKDGMYWIGLGLKDGARSSKMQDQKENRFGTAHIIVRSNSFAEAA